MFSNKYFGMNNDNDRPGTSRPSSAFGVRVQKAVLSERKDDHNRTVEESDVHYLSPGKLVSAKFARE